MSKRVATSFPWQRLYTPTIWGGRHHTNVTQIWANSSEVVWMCYPCSLCICVKTPTNFSLLTVEPVWISHLNSLPGFVLLALDNQPSSVWCIPSLPCRLPLFSRYTVLVGYSKSLSPSNNQTVEAKQSNAAQRKRWQNRETSDRLKSIRDREKE